MYSSCRQYRHFIIPDKAKITEPCKELSLAFIEMTDLTKPKDVSWTSAIMGNAFCATEQNCKVVKMENLCTIKKHALETAGM